MKNKANQLNWKDISKPHSDLTILATVLYDGHGYRNAYGFEIVDLYGSIEVELHFIKISTYPHKPDLNALKTGDVIRTLGFDSVRQAKTRASQIAKTLELHEVSDEN